MVNYILILEYLRKNEYNGRKVSKLKDTENMTIQYILVEDKYDMVNIYLTDGTKFSVHVKNYGKWYICEV